MVEFFLHLGLKTHVPFMSLHSIQMSDDRSSAYKIHALENIGLLTIRSSSVVCDILVEFFYFFIFFKQFLLALEK